MALDERWQGAHHLLAMRLDNIGDVVMTGPALQAIKEQLPDARLTLLVSPNARGAAALLPWVDQVLVWRSLWQDMGSLPFDPDREIGLIQTLQALRFDGAIIFTSFSQSPHPAGYACYLAGIPLRLAEPKSFGGGVLSHMPPTPTPLEAHQIDRNLRLLEAIGLEPRSRSLAVEVPPAAVAAATGLLAGRLPSDAPYVLLSPWTSCQARTYPLFGEAARLLQQATGLPIIVTGAERDRPHVDALLAEIGPSAVDLVGRTTVPELAALVAGARLLLTNNTSTMHLADALRTPQVVLFAGTELEEQWAPRSGPARLLRRATLCHPCFQFACRRDLACLAIEPEQVVAAALELLQSASPYSPLAQHSCQRGFPPSPCEGEGMPGGLSIPEAKGERERTGEQIPSPPWRLGAAGREGQGLQTQPRRLPRRRKPRYRAISGSRPGVGARPATLKTQPRSSTARGREQGEESTTPAARDVPPSNRLWEGQGEGARPW